MDRRFERIPVWSFTIVCTLLILWLTLVPKPLGELKAPFFPGADKLAHAIMFGGLVLCAAFDRYRSGHRLTVTFLLLAAACATLLGIVIEFMQRAMHAGRGFELADMIADCAGAFVVAIGIILFKK